MFSFRWCFLSAVRLHPLTLVELYCRYSSYGQDASKGVYDEGDLLNRNSTVELVARVIATQWFQSIYTNMSQRGVHLTWTPYSVIS